MLQVNAGSQRRCIQVVLCITLLSVANTISANQIVQGDGQESLMSPIKISVVTGSQEVSYPAIWGNYVVWKGAENEVYAIDQDALVPMPGLEIDGVPAIWENIVVWEGSRHYYDLETQTLEKMYVNLPVGENPAISNRKIVWDNSIGYFDIDLDTMVNTKDLIVGDSPDIDGDRIVWSGSEGYYDIQKQRMIQPRGLDVGLDPAIHGQKITWSYLKGGYYDLDLETYGHARIITGRHPDIFGNQILWLGGLVGLPGPVAVWEPTCGTQIVDRNDAVNRSQIYDNLVVWDDAGNKSDRLFISQAPGFGPTIKVTTSLDKSVYAMNDVIKIDITAVNHGSEPFTLWFPDSCQVSYRIDGIWYSFEEDWCLHHTTKIEVGPNMSHTWYTGHTLSISMYPNIVFTPGTHSITGVVNGHAESDIVEFEIGPE